MHLDVTAERCGFFDTLAFHRRVRVTGTLDDDGFGLLLLRPAGEADVVRLSGAAAVGATPVDTGEVSEDTEGLLVVERRGHPHSALRLGRQSQHPWPACAQRQATSRHHSEPAGQRQYPLSGPR
ncbi:MAG: hypothetical protein ACREXW_05730 [Gammaproteobacteria bacterium]